MDIIEFQEWLLGLLSGQMEPTEVEAVPHFTAIQAIEVIMPGQAFPAGKRFRVTVQEA